MNLILDTHILIWILEGNPKITNEIRTTIEDTQNHIFISQASIWELTIKISIGKLTLPIPLSDLFFYVERSGWAILPIQNSDFLKLQNLPYHHTDLFDRIIISQCLNHDFKLITRDKSFKSYGLTIL